MIKMSKGLHAAILNHRKIKRVDFEREKEFWKTLKKETYQSRERD